MTGIPTAATGSFPYPHRTIAQVDRHEAERAHDTARSREYARIKREKAA